MPPTPAWGHEGKGEPPTHFSLETLRAESIGKEGGKIARDAEKQLVCHKWNFCPATGERNNSAKGGRKYYTRLAWGQNINFSHRRKGADGRGLFFNFPNRKSE